MWIRLAHEADAAVVAAQLQGMGLWTRPLEDAQGATTGFAIERLMEAGMALGEAFQLIDDVLDLEGEPAETGKVLFTDLREGKMTWPLILAAERVDGFVEQVRRCMSDEGGLDSERGVVQTLSLIHI